MKFSRRRPFKVLSKRAGFRGGLVHLDILQIQTKSGKRYEREVIKHPGAVVIIPRRPDGRLILIRQLRVATGQEMWEFPAGTLERGETPLECARRELEEETGWRAGRLRKILEFFPTPGISNEKMFLFLAGGLRESGVQNPDADEELTVKSFTRTAIESMIRQRRLIDGKTILGFLLCKLFP